MTEVIKELIFEEQIRKEEGSDFSTLFLRGDDSLSAFLGQGGVSSEKEFVKFILSRMDRKEAERIEKGLIIPPADFGCSVCSVKGENGGYLFGRNFDLRHCGMMILKSEPKNAYASISTLSPDFLLLKPGEKLTDPKYDAFVKTAALYIPMDGMNEMGLCAAVNKIQDDVIINQNDPGKINHMAGTLIRHLLDRAADVDEALKILENTNFRMARGYFVHFTVADAKGHCICAEYIDNRLHIVEEAHVVTNHYLTQGEKFGIGTDQSHIRYRTLCDIIRGKEERNERFAHGDLKQALVSVAKKNFPEDGERFTEWSIVFDQSEHSACFYRREDFEHGFVASI